MIRNATDKGMVASSVRSACNASKQTRLLPMNLKNQNLIYVIMKIRMKIRPHSEALSIAVTECTTVGVATSMEINFNVL